MPLLCFSVPKHTLRFPIQFDDFFKLFFQGNLLVFNSFSIRFQNILKDLVIIEICWSW